MRGVIMKEGIIFTSSKDFAYSPLRRPANANIRDVKNRNKNMKK
jgi:hypothetical protein